VLLPSSQLTKQVLPQVCVSTVGVFCTFAFFLYCFQTNEKKVTATSLQQQQRYQLAHRLTNVVAFAVLAVIGLYGELYVIPLQPIGNVATFIQGMDDHTWVISFMFSFQLWSLWAGVYYVQESTVMRMHHMAVLVVAVLYAAFTNGFRYHGYYFAGVWEVSSIPLAFMNMFREDYPAWKDRYPITFFVIKVAFAFSFLIVRIWIGTRRAIRYVTDIWLTVYVAVQTNMPLMYSTFMFIMASMSTFLAVLQFYWAALIIAMIGRNAKDILKPLLRTGPSTVGEDSKKKV
jgi:hypothetical protein